MRWTEPGWRGTVLGMVVPALLGAAFAKAWRSTRWPAGLGRTAAAYVAVNPLGMFAARHPVLGAVAADALETIRAPALTGADARAVPAAGDGELAAALDGSETSRGDGARVERAAAAAAVARWGT
jgi:hypothetical protein